MGARPVYWMLCGAGATLLTSAWGSRQIVPQNPNESAPSVIAQAKAESVAGGNLMMKRQPWTEPKFNPFAKAPPVIPKIAASVSDAPAPQPPSFPYVFIGRLLGEDKNAIFLSRNDQIYSVEAGDTIEGVYRIDKVGGNALEITYLPEQKNITFPFDSLVAKPTAQAIAVLSRTDMPSASQSREQALPVEVSPLLAQPQPSEEDVLKMMGATPPPDGNPIDITSSPVQDGQTPPPLSAGPHDVSQPAGQ